MWIVAPIKKNPANKAKISQQKGEEKNIFFCTVNMNETTFSITFPKGFLKSKKFGCWTLGSGGKKTFKGSKPMKKNVNNFFCRDNFTLSMSKSFQI